MSDAEDEAEAEEADEPVVELGEHTPVEGAPFARVASRLFFPLQKSVVDAREGDSVIRTPDGPRELSTVLEDVETTYFQSSDEFTAAVRDVVGTGPVETE